MRSLVFIILAVFLGIFYGLLKKTLKEIFQASPQSQTGTSSGKSQTKTRWTQRELEQYYRDVLQIDGHIDSEILRRRYRELMAKYHPDKVQHLGTEFHHLAEQKTKELNEAYEFLRKKYGC